MKIFTQKTAYIFLSTISCSVSINTENGETAYVKIWNALRQALSEATPSFQNAILIVSELLSVMILYGCLSSVAGESVTLRASGCLAVMLIAVNNLKGFYSVISQTVSDVMIVIHTSLPVLTAYTAVAGQNASVIASQAIYLTLLDLTGTAIKELILPFIGLFFAISSISCVTKIKGLMETSDAIKSLINFGLKLFLTLFIGYTGVIKIFGTIGDSIAKRGIRLAVSSTVPVIGSIAAEAAESIFAVISLERGAAGIAGILSILTAALLPMLQIGVFYLVFKLFSFFLPAFSGEDLGTLVKRIADGYAMLFAIAAALFILGLLAVLSTFIYTQNGI